MPRAESAKNDGARVLNAEKDLRRTATREVRVPGVAWLGLLALSLAWGTSFVVTRFALESAPPSTIVAGRILVAALTLNAARLTLGLRLPRDRASWRRFTAFALTGSVIPFTLISWGQVVVESALAGILLTTSPLFVLVFAHALVPGEQATPRRVAGFVIGALAMVVLLDPAALSGLASPDRWVRQLAVLGGSVCYALNTTLVRRSADVHPLVYASGVMLVAAPMAVVGALLLDGPTLPASAPAIGTILWLGLVPTGLATLVHHRVVAHAGPSFAALTSYLVPVVAVLAGVLLFDERLPASALVAFALLALGIAIGQAPRARRREPERPAQRAVALRR
ncbi:MAG: DMT family transporter [Myxococcota bacterium]